MNIENIVKDPTTAQIEDRKMIQLNEADVVYLEEIPQQFRAAALKNWYDMGFQKKKLPRVEMARVRMVFFDSFMAALEACGKLGEQ